MFLLHKYKFYIFVLNKNADILFYVLYPGTDSRSLIYIWQAIYFLLTTSFINERFTFEFIVLSTFYRNYGICALTLSFKICSDKFNWPNLLF